MGSNIEGKRRSGSMLPPAAKPMPPCSMAPRSVMMSPNRLEATTTSNHSGFFTIHIDRASTRAMSVSTSGKSPATLVEHRVPEQPSRS